MVERATCLFPASLTPCIVEIVEHKPKTRKKTQKHLATSKSFPPQNVLPKHFQRIFTRMPEGTSGIFKFDPFILQMRKHDQRMEVLKVKQLGDPAEERTQR